MGKIKIYSKLLLSQVKTKFNKPREYQIPRCGISFTKMSKLSDEIKGINIVKGQDTKSTTFIIKSKSPDFVFALVSQMAELLVPTGSPSKKDKQKLMELGEYIKKLEPQVKNLDLYREAATLAK